MLLVAAPPRPQTNVFVGKAAAKEQLQAECGLPIDPSAPLYAFIGRCAVAAKSSERGGFGLTGLSCLLLCWR